MNSDFKAQSNLMKISFIIAIILLVVKVIATVKTGSSSLFSDAVEAATHTLAVAFAWWSLHISFKPADKEHSFGHDKIAFVSEGVEGGMVVLASLFIIWESIRHLIVGGDISNALLGIVICAFAVIVNLMLGCSLIKLGKKNNSKILIADGKHVLTDVWTSGGALIAIVLVHFTHIWWIDPIIAILCGFNILHIGVVLIKQSYTGLLDEVDLERIKIIEDILSKETSDRNLTYHALRYRHSGHRTWIEFHLCFDKNIAVNTAHDLAYEIETALKKSLGKNTQVISHLEPNL